MQFIGFNLVTRGSSGTSKFDSPVQLCHHDSYCVSKTPYMSRHQTRYTEVLIKVRTQDRCSIGRVHKKKLKTKSLIPKTFIFYLY